VDSKYRIFQEKWTDEYFCVSMNGKALCLICNESISVFKDYNIARYYNSKHKVQNCVDALGREKNGGLSRNRMFLENSPLIVLCIAGKLLCCSLVG
jgi:hypothetical protein